MLHTLTEIFILKVSHFNDIIRHKKQKIRNFTFSIGKLRLLLVKFGTLNSDWLIKFSGLGTPIL